MKTHIVRAPQTDRYGFAVPTKASELEPDTSSARFIGEASLLLSSPSTPQTAFSMAGVTLTENVGFTVPSGNLDITIPQTGLYSISAVFTWASTTSTGSGVGRTTTPGAYSLQTVFTGLVQGVIDGTYLRDNKLGPLTTSPGDIGVVITASLVAPLTQGTVISPYALAVAAAANLTARMTFLIARIA